MNRKLRYLKYVALIPGAVLIAYFFAGFMQYFIVQGKWMMAACWTMNTGMFMWVVVLLCQGLRLDYQIIKLQEEIEQMQAM